MTVDTRIKDSVQYRRAKLALGDRLRRDARLSISARLIGAEIISRSWEVYGCTDAENWLVKVLGVALRTVRGAVRELRETGYIRVEKHGRSNHYFLELGQNLPLSEPKESGGATEAKNDRKKGKEPLPTQAKSETPIPSRTPYANPVGGDRDGDALALDSEFQIEAKSLALQLAEIAGLPKNAVWPLHWQNAQSVVARWRNQGWPVDAILTGAQITMSRKPEQTPPNSITYFESEIRKVVAIRSGNSSLRDHQRALFEIAARIGWDVLALADSVQAEQLVMRWHRGELSDGDLHRIKCQLESRSQAIDGATRETATG
jgi:hypothetical protein